MRHIFLILWILSSVGCTAPVESATVASAMEGPIRAFEIDQKTDLGKVTSFLIYKSDANASLFTVRKNIISYANGSVGSSGETILEEATCAFVTLSTGEKIVCSKDARRTKSVLETVTIVTNAAGK